MAGLLIGSIEGDRHDTGAGHPERPERVRAVERGLADAGVRDACTDLTPRPATWDEITAVHDERYCSALSTLCSIGGGELDPDTPVAPGSWDAALLAAGLAVDAVARLRHGQHDAAFVAARPPGHHATRSRGMGFCLLNNVAIAAASILGAGERVAIIDWDVHHGNGTQEIFWDEPGVLYVSTHEAPGYPGTGLVSETGGAGAPGTVVNIPLPEGATGDAGLAALDLIVAPAIEAFGPDWVLISAGFDAHRDDPLAGLAWSAGDFADLTRRVTGLAPSTGRLVAILEGGYDVDALAASAGATAAAMVGSSYRPEPATSGGPGLGAVERALTIRNRLVEGAR